MYCTNCGTKMENGANVCPICGKLNKNATVMCSEQKTVSVPKKMPKGLLFGIISAVALVAVVVVAVSCWGRVSNFFAKNFTSAGKYYAHVEKDNIESTVSLLYNAYEAVNYEKDEKQGTTSVLRVELGDSMKDIYRFFKLEEYLEWLESVEFVIDTDLSPDYQGLGLVGKLNDKSVLTASMILDMKNASVYVNFPELLEKTLKVQFDDEEFSDSISSVTDEMTLAMQELQEIIPSRKVAEKLLVKYFDIIVENIDDIKKEKDKLEVGNIAQSCTLITAKIDAETMMDVVLAVLEEAKDDSEIKEIVFDIAEAGDNDPEGYYDEFVSGIEGFIDEIENTASEELDDYLGNDIVLKSWINGNGEIIGREIKLNDGSVIEMHFVEKGSNVATELVVKSEGRRVFEFSGNGKKSGKDKLNGEYILEIYGEEYAKVEVQDFDCKAYEKDGYVNGEFYFSLGDGVDLSDLIDQDESPVDFLALLDDVKLGIEVRSSEKEASLSISVINDEETYVTLKVGSERRGFKNPSIPKDKNCEVIDSNDENAMEDVLADIDFEQIIKNLEDAGVSEEIIDYLTYFLMYGGF